MRKRKNNTTNLKINSEDNSNILEKDNDSDEENKIILRVSKLENSNEKDINLYYVERIL